MNRGEGGKERDRDRDRDRETETERQSERYLKLLLSILPRRQTCLQSLLRRQLLRLLWFVYLWDCLSCRPC